MSYRDLTASLPSKSCCNAAHPGRTGVLSHETEEWRGICCWLFDLGEGEEPTVQRVYGRSPLQMPIAASSLHRPIRSDLRAIPFGFSASVERSGAEKRPCEFA